MVSKSRKEKPPGRPGNPAASSPQKAAQNVASPAADTRRVSFRLRLLTALALMPIALLGAYIGGLLWALVLTPLLIIGLMEFYTLTRNHAYHHGHRFLGTMAGFGVFLLFYIRLPQYSPLVFLLALLVTFLHESLQKKTPPQQAFLRALTTLCGLLYLALPLAFLVAVRQSEAGFLWLMVIFGGTWGTDTFAYLGGHIWGKRPLAPKLSPKKTLEGAITGVVGGWFFPALFLMQGGQLNLMTGLWVLIIPFIAIVGDLLESAIKRYFRVKDSHLEGLNVIPGHGGVLDRIDALLLVSLFSYVWLLLLRL